MSSYSQERAWDAAGIGVALATVASTWGSAPRPAGSLLAANAGGEFAGSVSGGCVEAEVIREARLAIADGAPRLLRFGVSDARAYEVGLACGGTIEVQVARLPRGEVLDALLARVAAREPVVLATDLSSGDALLADPRAPEATLDPALAADVRAAVARDATGRAEAGGRAWLLRPFNPAIRVVVCGAVHVAQALVPMVRLAGYEAVVVDPRRAFATEARFGSARVVCAWPDEALAGLHLDLGSPSRPEARYARCVPDPTETSPRPSGASLHAGPPVLDVRGLRKEFAGTTAVDGISLEVRPGEILGLVGPNGAGKTTTLRCVAGVIPSTWGSIRVAGHDLVDDPVRAKRDVAYLPDEPRLFDHLTVMEHLNFFARVYGVRDWRPAAAELLAELELVGKEDALASELSRGMKQKLSIACGFLHAPRLVLLDEPLTGLDPLGMRRLKRSLADRAVAGAALVLSSHLLGLIEELCHRVVVLDRGRVAAEGTLDEIRARLSGAEGASFEDLFLRITSGGGAA